MLREHVSGKLGLWPKREVDKSRSFSEKVTFELGFKEPERIDILGSENSICKCPVMREKGCLI